MATELQQMIDVVAKDKGIDPTIVISAIEDAYLAASRKVSRATRTCARVSTSRPARSSLRRAADRRRRNGAARGDLARRGADQLYGEEAEVGMEIEFPKETEKLGRIAAQTAKQVIAQRVREAEREKIHGEFSQRVGEVVNAMVKRFESGDIIAEIGRVEARFRARSSRARKTTPSAIACARSSRP